MKVNTILNLSAALLVVIIIILATNESSAQGTPRDLSNSNYTDPMIIYSESGYNGANATLNNVRNVTLKNNMLAPDKPYRVITKNLTIQIGDVEIRKNGTVYKNCLLQGDINGDGEYKIMSFRLFNQTQIREYYGDSDLNYSAVNLTYQEFPELPNIICKFATESTGIALTDEERDRVRNGNDLRVARFGENALIWIAVAILAIIAIIIIYKKYSK